MNLKKELIKIPIVNICRISYNRYWNYKKRKRKVAMMHIGRVGSTVLGTMMNQHTKVFWDGEPFERRMHDNREQKNDFVQRVINESWHNSRSEIYCFATKFMPEQHLWTECINLNLAHYLDELKPLGFDDVIFIKRENYLRQVVSVLVGRKKKEWHSQNKTGLITQVKIDINNYEAGYHLKLPLLDYFNRIDKQYTLLNNLVKPNKMLVLSYEKDIEKDPFIAYNKVCDYLNINKENPKVSFKKTNPFELHVMIENYNEVYSVLHNSKYGWMLEE